MVWRRAAVVLALAVAAAACAQILGFKPAGRKPFPHRAHVLAGASCLTCHPGVESAGDEGPLHLPDDASCVTCHTRPHDERSCLGCHGGEWTALGAMQAREHLRFDHARHQEVTSGNCVRCHSSIQEPGQLLRPAMAVCLKCHEHEGDFQARACDRCHVDLAEEGVPPQSHLVHEGDFLREHGVRAASSADLCSTCHSERFCGSCHGTKVPALPSRLAFDQPGQASVHRAGFAARHSIEASAQPGACASCHQPEACLGCHTEKKVASGGMDGLRAGNPHPPGWVGLTSGENAHGRAARRDPASCASCHGGAGEALCVSCHKVGGVGGSIHPPGFSSRRSLGELPCRMCHLGAL
jgi:predicted CXXCH cytochrome family protein